MLKQLLHTFGGAIGDVRSELAVKQELVRLGRHGEHISRCHPALLSLVLQGGGRPDGGGLPVESLQHDHYGSEPVILARGGLHGLGDWIGGRRRVGVLRLEVREIEDRRCAGGRGPGNPWRLPGGRGDVEGYGGDRVHVVPFESFIACDREFPGHHRRSTWRSTRWSRDTRSAATQRST